jgi:DNA replicative helicase MCM subunit Mcm2 (Cdc46/Mcm family)
MEDDLDRLGVAPSDRRKLESMKITRLEQIALLNHEQLGMGRGKGSAIIRRARNIIAHEAIKDIEVGDNIIRVYVRNKSNAILKSVLSVLGVYNVPPGAAALIEKDGVFELHRKGRGFDRIVEASKVEKEILDGSGIEEESVVSEEQVLDFAKERGFDGFWRNVFDEIKGNEVMKKALTVSMFSTFEEPVHTVVIGEPGSSKTLAKEIIERNFKNVTTVGANTTRAGLVINLATGEMGALAYSDKKVVLVDELDKIPEEDIEHCYELLSNGRCSVHSAKIHEEIESRFIMIAFANPSSQVFDDKPMKGISLPPLLMSRFALIVKTEKIDRESRLSLFEQKFYGRGEIREKPSFYNQWVEMAQSYNPSIKASSERVRKYLESVNDLVEEHYTTKLRRDLRMGDYMRRIPQAIARASFGDVVDETLDEAEQILHGSVESWQK